MGIHKALTRLVSEVPSVDEEATQILVSSARVWCALFAFGESLKFTQLRCSEFTGLLPLQSTSESLQIFFVTTES